ncbi:MAG: TolB family protein [Oscillochloridaceae bacterium umkhey_bin13]
MTLRRWLLIAIGGLSLIVLVGGVAVAALALNWLGREAPRTAQELLVVGADRRLTLFSASGSQRILAEDQSDDLFRYPSSAPDGGRIIYMSSDREGVALMSLDLASGTRALLYRSSGEPPLYAGWSPDGRHVSFLINRRGGGLAAYIVPADGSREAALIGTSEASTYFAWRPDGRVLLLHTGSSRNGPGRIATFAPGNPEPLSEMDDPGFFQAPAWSVTGEAFFYVAQPAVRGALTPDQVESVLTRRPADGGPPQVLASERQAALLFSRAPSSDDLAYTTVGPGGFGPLKLVAADGSPARLISRPDQAVMAFFWSPDGSQIAYLTAAPRQQGGLPELTWHTVTLTDGRVRDLASFTPSPAFAALLNFFDAYAITLDLWSPDGRELVYGGSDGVYALPVMGGEPRRVADGVLGLWMRQ